MPLKKLKHITYRMIEKQSHFDIYHPENREMENRHAIVFCHALINTKEQDAILNNTPKSLSFAFLAPAGYELFAVKGHLSDYKMSEFFDTCKQGESYTNYALSPPLSEIFSYDDNDSAALLTVHNDFDTIIIKKPLTLSELIENHDAIQAYDEIIFHCSRCKQDELNIKYFLPVEQHAHILAQNKPLDWSCF